MIKHCKGCGEDKIHDEFYRTKTSADGRGFYCKVCAKEKSRQSHKRRYAKRSQEILAKNKAYRDRNPEKVKDRADRYYRDNRDKIAKRQANRYKNHLESKLSGIFRRWFEQAFKRAFLDQPPDTLRYLGCSLSEFGEHIEAQWESGMSWGNHGRGKGTWQLDHVKPVCGFDFLDEDQIVECFSFRNVKPRWHHDHVAKTGADRTACTNARKIRAIRSRLYIEELEKCLDTGGTISQARENASLRFQSHSITDDHSWKTMKRI